MSSTNLTNRRRELAFAAVFWCGVLAVLALTASAVGLAKRGLPLEGWTGTPVEQVVDWTVTTLPYVFVAWLPMALVAISITGLLNLSRRTWVTLSLVLATVLLIVFVVVS